MDNKHHCNREDTQVRLRRIFESSWQDSPLPAVPLQDSADAPRLFGLKCCLTAYISHHFHRLCQNSNHIGQPTHASQVRVSLPASHDAGQHEYPCFPSDISVRFCGRKPMNIRILKALARACDVAVGGFDIQKNLVFWWRSEWRRCMDVSDQRVLS
ncbi:hypothetical protein BDZ45DRAFT_249635 [Acephala macrosclerotiorum]|nr:hypothetical protein BDZ45DRAFT_249635 [Acephala macrosclerotiorum]